MNRWPGAAAGVRLLIDVGDVGLQLSAGDAEVVGNLQVLVFGQHEGAQHVSLAVGEAELIRDEVYAVFWRRHGIRCAGPWSGGLRTLHGALCERVEAALAIAITTTASNASEQARTSIRGSCPAAWIRLPESVTSAAKIHPVDATSAGRVVCAAADMNAMALQANAALSRK